MRYIPKVLLVVQGVMTLAFAVLTLVIGDAFAGITAISFAGFITQLNLDK